MVDALTHITEQIQLYRRSPITDGDAMVGILQQLTATLFYLETERSKYHDKFQCRINELILDGSTVSRAENQAHKEIPEMYQLRHVMSSAYKVVEAIRSQLSWLKTEKHNSQ